MLRSLAALSLIVQLTVSQSTTETVHGAVIFSRHGDRTWKGAPPTRLTTVGQNQLFNSGEYWRARYLDPRSEHQISGISVNTYDHKQLSTSTPDQPILVTSGQAFLQGLYPPTSFSEKLANGTMLQAPLSGFQYAPVTTVPEDSSETIWLKGDDGCPAFLKSSETWDTTREFNALQESTKDFYLSFYDTILDGVIPKNKVVYSNAYSIYDYINVGVIHNTTIANAVSPEELFQLQTLANSAEFAQNGNITSTSDPIAISGRTLSKKILTQLETVISSKGETGKFSLLIGSYDTFLAFFGLAGLPSINADFYGIPDYGSTLTFEVFSYTPEFPNEKDLRVRFLFRNGTENGAAREFPLFGSSEIMTWNDFRTGMSDLSLDSVEEWCTLCESTEAFCKQYSSAETSSSSSSAPAQKGLKPAVAGVIGAVVTLGAFTLVAIAALAGGLRVSKKNKQAIVIPAGKQSESSSLA